MARGDVFYEGFQYFKKDDKTSYLKSGYTRDEVQTYLDGFEERQVARGYGADRYWIEERHCDTDFEIPSQPKSRDRYRAEVTKAKDQDWFRTHIDIFEGDTKLAEFDRNYGFLGTFEPFRQGERNFALISPDYTATSIMDLDTGEIIAGEEHDTWGFCPVGFYVPDWWDLHDGSIIPGDNYWSENMEWPVGDFGFVWGCIWGDDSSWKVQYLDLSKIQEGILHRDDRFGYVELATHSKNPRDFIFVSYRSHRVQFATELYFDLKSGEVNADMLGGLHLPEGVTIEDTKDTKSDGAIGGAAFFDTPIA